MEALSQHSTAKKDNRMQIMTVLGPISPDEIGFTQTHEHLILDGARFEGAAYDAILYDVDLAIEEVSFFKEAGGSCMVEVTSIGLDRDPLALKRISSETGVHIVMGTGWYREAVYPSCVHQMGPNELADILIKEIRAGVDETGIRPGIIGEIGTERRWISPAQERVFRACARVHLETGAPISTHTTHFGELALEQLDLLEEEGVDPHKVIIGHLGDRRGIEYFLPIADRGAFLEIDNLGFGAPYQTDEERAKNVARFIQKGHLQQILLSMDICANRQLHYFGGRGYDYVLRNFLPLLEKHGVTKQEIETIMVDNPRRALAF